MIKPGYEQYRTISKEQFQYVPLFCEKLGDRATPISLSEKFRNRTPFVLLESADRGEIWGRYSFLIFDVDEVWEIWEFGDLISFLEKTFPQVRVFPGLPVPFVGGAVGFLSYDAVKTWEHTVPKREIEFPLGYFVKARRFIYFDHLKHLIGIVYLARAEDREDFERGKEWIKKQEEEINREEKIDVENDFFQIRRPIESNFSQQQFMKSVTKVIQLIEEGHASQVVISQRFSTEFAGDPFRPYRFLRSLNPSPYLFYLDGGSFQIVGSSPEMLVKLQGSTIFTKPIAGTRKRREDLAEEEIIQDLMSDEKERAEHTMLLDLGRNDLGRVCTPGTVKVEEMMAVERYSHVFHIVSTVSGQLSLGTTSWRALQACFPAGTVSGAPKVRAMEIIEEIEPQSRGPYAGSLGYLSFDGNMDMCIVIRSLFFQQGKVSVQAGAGIVYDSIPENEYQETKSKAEALLLALKMSQGE